MTRGHMQENTHTNKHKMIFAANGFKNQECFERRVRYKEKNGHISQCFRQLGFPVIQRRLTERRWKHSCKKQNKKKNKQTKKQKKKKTEPPVVESFVLLHFNLDLNGLYY